MFYILKFTVGVAVTSDAFELASALNDYSHVFNATDRPDIFGVLLARCVTGLGPTDTSSGANGVLGGWYFNGTMIRNGGEIELCSSDVIQVRPGGGAAGVINIRQCGVFNTSVEGIYTCIMMNSSMMNQSLRLGMYFTGRSESCTWFIYPIT